MSLFPTYLTKNLEQQKKREIPREYGIDFKTGQLTGKIVEGKEAIQVWIWLVLQIPRYRFFIYSWDYGNEYESFIGKIRSEEYIRSEAKRMTEECLLINENIQSISDFEVSKKDGILAISFTVNTIYGSISFLEEKILNMV